MPNFYNQCKLFFGAEKTGGHVTEVVETLQSFLIKEGVLREGGHFAISERQHVSTLIEKRELYKNPRVLRRIANKIATKVFVECARENSPYRRSPKVVLGREDGAAKLALMVAEELSHMYREDVCAAYMEKRNGRTFVCADSWQLVFARPILVVDDICRTGEALGSAINAVIEAGGDLSAVAVLFNRTNMSMQSITSARSFVVVDGSFPSYPPGPATCPECRDGIPLMRVY